LELTIAEALDGLPADKMHCSNLVTAALHAGTRQYQCQPANDTITLDLVIHRRQTVSKSSEKVLKSDHAFFVTIAGFITADP
jgi:hypothetical protein